MKSFQFTILAIFAIEHVSAFAPNPILAVQKSDVATAARTAASVTVTLPITSSTRLAFEKNNDRDSDNVRTGTGLIGNIDATTITTIGFGLIAFNFFVLANMGDGGIAGFVATIINTFG
uniref:Uncharacterized protein n=1 Tax=Chaetoceros debilis TaxID=122233 RepID=A0A7S3PYA2_9STRA|mmetsp:Transcript_10592/g.16061  ORF Transcript_10592/g.16061 Transcript_10592/m.16061 type:complete len:119 (+) Transcript_10592:124-480(+)